MLFPKRQTNAERDPFLRTHRQLSQIKFTSFLSDYEHWCVMLPAQRSACSGDSTCVYTAKCSCFLFHRQDGGVHMVEVAVEKVLEAVRGKPHLLKVRSSDGPSVLSTDPMDLTRIQETRAGCSGPCGAVTAGGRNPNTDVPLLRSVHADMIQEESGKTSLMGGSWIWSMGIPG